MLNLDNEIWMTIAGWPNYMISNMARVKSLSRLVPCGTSVGFRRVKDSILSPFICKQTGYPQVVFSRKKQNVHRLVAIAFLGDPPNPSAQVNHKNGDRSNSTLSNLEWVSPSENVAHGFRENGRKAHNIGKIGEDSTSGRPVISINIKTGKETRYEAAMDAVRSEGFTSGGISRACNSIIKSHAGHFWRFADA